MTKTDYYNKHRLTPDSGNVVNSWGAVQSQSQKYLFQCWDDEKRFIKKEDRTDGTVMVVKLLSPQDLGLNGSGAQARNRSILAVQAGATGYVAVSTGKYPNWIDAANLDQVYPVLILFEIDGEIFAKVGSPLSTAIAFHP